MTDEMTSRPMLNAARTMTRGAAHRRRSMVAPFAAAAACVCSGFYGLSYAAWSAPTTGAVTQDGQAALPRRLLLGGLAGSTVALASDPALALEQYEDSSGQVTFNYATGLQKAPSTFWTAWYRDLVEPLEYVGLRVTRTVRSSIREIGTAEQIGKKLMEDSIPPEAPKELLSYEIKTSKKGRDYGIFEWHYQWKFPVDVAESIKRSKFQLRQRALLTINANRQYLVLVSAEEERWPTSIESLETAINSFKIK